MILLSLNILISLRVVRIDVERDSFSPITFELSGIKLRSSFMSGGGAQRWNELERFVWLIPVGIHFFVSLPKRVN